MPKSLHLIRGHEHAITLKKESDPVNVRTYWYPWYQRYEIKILIKEMLDAGLYNIAKVHYYVLFAS